MGSWLFPKGNPNTNPPATRLRVQSSMQGVVRPIVWGQTRIAGNLIDYQDFSSQTQSQSSGGKGLGSTGGGGKGATNPQTNYTVTPVIGLCEGPITTILSYWNNKQFSNGFAPFTLFIGGYSQTGWSYFTSAHPGHDLAYRGLAYVADANFFLGNSPELPQLSFEVLSGVSQAYAVTGSNTLPDNIKNVYNVSGYPLLKQGSSPMSATSTVGDANPRDVVVDFLTNVHYGVGWPANRLDTTMNDYSSACLALGLVISPAMVEATEAASFLQTLADATIAGFRWSNGKLTMVPYYDTAITSGTQSMITETHLVPVPKQNLPPQIQVGLGGFVSNTKVQRSGGGTVLTQIAFTNSGVNLNTNQYTVNPSGLYTFSGADIGVSVDITYTNAAQASYQPNTTPIYDISDFLPNQGTAGATSGNQPIQVVRKPVFYMYNSVKLEWLDRNNNYDPSVIEIKDQAAIDAFALRARDTKQSHFFCVGASATISATLQLQREQIANVYTFTVGPEFILLEVEDLITLTRPVMGLNKQPVRITEIQENSDCSLTITAEEYMGTVGSPLYVTQLSQGGVTNYNVAPGNVNTPWIFEPPTAVTNGGLEIWCAVSGFTPSVWGGCHVWASYDGVNYSQVGNIVGGARMGLTTADLPPVAQNTAVGALTIDSTGVLAIDLTESNGSVISASALDMQNFNTKCWVANSTVSALTGEIIAYQTAALTATNKYNLTTLNRGGFGTTIADHPSGSPFARLDSGIFALSYNQQRVGKTIFFKFQSYNVYGGGLQDLSSIGAIAYTVQGQALTSPLPNPVNPRIMFTAAVTQLWWDEVTDFRNPIYEIRKGPSFTSGLNVGRQAHPPFVVLGNDTYWISGFVIVNNTSVYSASPASLVINNTILSKNVFSFNEQSTASWTGTLVNMTAFGSTGPTQILQLNQASTTGTYEIPSSHQIDVGYVANNLIGAVYQAQGSPVGQNILSTTQVPNILTDPDVLGSANTQNIISYLEIAVSTNGSTFNAYQKFNPGVYPGRKYKFRATITNNDSTNTTGFIEALSYSVDVPTRLDHYTAQSVSSLGSTFVFRPDGQSTAPFNSGINGSTIPYVNFTFTGLSTGDTPQYTTLDLNHVVVKIVDSAGNPQARTVTFSAEGY